MRNEATWSSLDVINHAEVHWRGGRGGVHFELMTTWCPSSFEETPTFKWFRLQSKEIIFRWCNKSARLAKRPGLIPSGCEIYFPLTQLLVDIFRNGSEILTRFKGLMLPLYSAPRKSFVLIPGNSHSSWIPATHWHLKAAHLGFTHSLFIFQALIFHA